MKFGDYLKDRRAEIGWTQPEAAAKAGIEQSYLSKLETGKSIPSGDVYARLVEAYGLNTGAMAGVLFPAELDRLRDIDEVRALLLRQARETRRDARRWLVAGLILLVLGGGLAGLAQVDRGRMVRDYSYQSRGIVLPGEPLEVFAALDEGSLDDESGDYESVRTDLLDRVDERMLTVTEMRGPRFVEDVPGGRRVWHLVGGSEPRPAQRFAWAYVPAFAAIIGGLACFFVGWRWPGDKAG
ncbi:hypothetical protein B5C34_04335 [Pacificimonas flava]|uniref:HTH cro/C1-type domain-containing protein n=2 Tax=Pacificimonas TaxID=1960290 RepID=A0A219B3J7_9SPHN|nr:MULTISPECIES: helix-turn-helix transcriptional regulator [Pacificimonas]MBZ6377553.1 helix-turn-helix transcriptional regulator [Pacificimonas aurantium]OWV32754.1 hypothetical protein B5C34_04335 [Pacificimonas flava]